MLSRVRNQFRGARLARMSSGDYCVIRDLGPLNPAVPEFPSAADALAPLRAHSEKMGSGDFSPLWCGQAAPLCRELPAGQLTKVLAAEALDLMKRLADT